MRRLLVPLALLAVLATGGTALAQEPAGAASPPDVSLAAFDLDALPEAPDGYATRAEGAVRWDYPIAAASVVDALAAAHRDAWPRIERELGADLDDALRIRIGVDPDGMAALAPDGAPPPAYAVGVAYPASGLVLLTLSAPETWERPDLVQVLAHELSHVALHRAVGGRDVPRWFSEGVAIHQARERSFDRVRTLWEATVRGTLVPIDDLSAAFHSSPRRVGIAYAESADFVDFLVRRTPDGEAKLAEMIGRIARGQSFENSVSQTWSLGIGQLESQWRTALSERFHALPLLVGTGSLWGLIMVLVVLAWWRRRRDARTTLKKWEIEEAAEARQAARARAVAELEARNARTAAARAQEADEDAAPRLDVPIPREERDPQLPTIEYEGRSHTLH
jgi:hypothetical protein